MRTLATCSALLLPLFVVACAGDDAPADGRAGPVSLAAADLSEIVERGRLRILRPRSESASHLPRRGHSLNLEVDLAESYAAELGVEPVWIYLDSRDQLLPALLRGRGDLIVANLTVTEEREEQVAFTVPVAVVREQLVARSDDYYLREPADLDGRRIAIRRSSSFWNTVGRLQEAYPGIELQVVDEDVDTEEIIYRVAVGQYDLTVADDNLVDACLEYRNDIRAAMDLTGDRPIAWAVRPDAEELRRSLDDFLTEAQLTDRGDELLLDDLPRIKQRRVLRLITRNMAATYFLWRGELMGFEYELMREFARRQGLRLEVMVPDAGEDPLRWLREGRGDVVSAALTPTPERARGGVVFTRPYNYVTQRVVARAGESGLQQAVDLAGRTFFVRRSSAYWDTLAELRDGGIELELLAAPEVEPTDEIIGKVATGEYDLTLSDSHVLAIEMSWRDDVRPVLDLKTEQPLAWAVRQSNPELKRALDRFIDSEYRGLHYNVIYEKYFKDEKKIRAHREGRNDQRPDISPYDGLVKKYAEQYGFDWRLIVAQMFQESRFDPDARSFAGARGLMQLLPRTAREFGFHELDDPETGIHAGVLYLDWVRNRFDDVISVRDRTWFALAAYNAGAGHVRHARRIATQQGLDPNRWFGNVEQAMLLLSRPQYAESSPHGYCRCSEPVRYVRDIRTRYNAYVEMAGS